MLMFAPDALEIFPEMFRYIVDAIGYALEFGMFYF